MSLFENNFMQHTKVAAITSSSSGIGIETSLLLARNCFYTYAIMRNIDKSNRIADLSKKDNLPLEVLQLDISNNESVKDVINIIAEKQGRIDEVVNNAGYGI